MINQAIEAFKRQDYEQAVQLSQDILQQDSLNITAHRILSMCLGKDYSAQTNHLAKAILMDSMTASQTEAWKSWVHSAKLHNRPQEVYQICFTAIWRGVNDPFFAETLSQLSGRRVPGILMATLPKAGSIFSLKKLSGLMGIPQVFISPCKTFPLDVIDPNLLQILSYGWAVCREHLAPSAFNLQALSHTMDRMMLLVRDPRQTSLSLVHHIIRELEAGRITPAYHWPSLPEDFLEHDLAWQIDWSLESQLPLHVQWLQGWREAVQDPGFKTEILVLQHERLKDDPTGYFQTLLDFYGLGDLAGKLDVSRPKEGQANNLNFRKGSNREWREIMGPGQLDRCNQAVPDSVLQFFDWER